MIYSLSKLTNLKYQICLKSNFIFKDFTTYETEEIVILRTFLHIYKVFRPFKALDKKMVADLKKSKNEVFFLLLISLLETFKIY